MSRAHKLGTPKAPHVDSDKDTSFPGGLKTHIKPIQTAREILFRPRTAINFLGYGMVICFFLLVPTFIAQAIEIEYAGYGVGNQTKDVTDIVKGMYHHGVKHFPANDNIFGDPDHKWNINLGNYLFIVWKADDNQLHSGVTGQREHTIDLP